MPLSLLISPPLTVKRLSPERRKAGKIREEGERRARQREEKRQGDGMNDKTYIVRNGSTDGRHTLYKYIVA